MIRIVGLFLLFTLVTLQQSCTIEKRTFRDGWHVEWKHHHRQAAAIPEKEAPETAVAAIREADAASTEMENVAGEVRTETMIPAEDPQSRGAAEQENDFTDAIADTHPAVDAAEPVISEERSHPKQILPLNPPPTGEAGHASGLWWVVALLVGIALASAIWLAVGTNGSAILLVALFVALVGSVIGSIVVSMRIKNTTPKEPEEDIQFDDLTENEIQRKKKLKGLIAVIVLVLGGVGIILIGSK